MKKPSSRKVAAKKVAPQKAVVKRAVVKKRVGQPIAKRQAPDRAPSSRTSVPTKRIASKAAEQTPRAPKGASENGAGVAGIRAKIPRAQRNGPLPIGAGSRLVPAAKNGPVKASRSAARQAIGMPRRGRADGKRAGLDVDGEQASMAALDRSVRIALDGMLACLGADTPADPPAISADLASARIWRWLKWRAALDDGTEMAPDILDGALSRAAADPHVESRGGLTATVLPPAVDLLRDLCLSETFEEFSLLVARLRSE